METRLDPRVEARWFAERGVRKLKVGDLKGAHGAFEIALKYVNEAMETEDGTTT